MMRSFQISTYFIKIQFEMEKTHRLSQSCFGSLNSIVHLVMIRYGGKQLHEFFRQPNKIQAASNYMII